VYVTDRARYTLLSPAAIEFPLDGPQQIEGRYGSEEFILEAWVKADESGLTMALFNSFGADFGELSLDDTGVSFVSTVFPPSVKGEYVAADFQFCFYRVDLLREALGAAGLTLITQTGSRGEERRIIRAGKRTIIEVEKSPGMVTYINHLRGYAYTLRGAF
jgi:hypothetical protein